jgi:hypothetical protein
MPRYEQQKLLSIQVFNLEDVDRGMETVITAVHHRRGLIAVQNAVLNVLYKYSVGIVHEETGALKSAIGVDRLAGELRLDPSVIKTDPPRRNQFPYQYGAAEHDRGGTHAFFKRAVDETQGSYESAAWRTMQSMLPQGGSGSSATGVGGLASRVLGSIGRLFGR